jgi:hypothetical protein
MMRFRLSDDVNEWLFWGLANQSAEINVINLLTLKVLDQQGDPESGSAQLSHMDDRAMLRVCNCPADDLVG